MPLLAQERDSLLPLELVNIPMEAVEVNEFIRREVDPELARPRLSGIRPQLDTIQSELDYLLENTEQLLAAELPWIFYKSLLFRWERISDKLEAVSREQELYEADLITLGTRISAQVARWEEGLEKIPNNRENRELRLRVAQVIEDLDSVKQIQSDSLAASLEMENTMSEVRLSINEEVLRLEEQEGKKLEAFLKERSEPIRTALARKDTFQSLFENQALVDFAIEDSHNFLRQKGLFLVWLVVVYLIILSILFWVSQNYFRDEKLMEDLKAGAYIFKRPFSTALMFTLVAGLFIIPDAPVLINRILTVVFLFPFLLIFHGLMARPLRWTLYFLVGLFFANQWVQMYYLDLRASRITTLLVGLAIAGFLIWFLIRQRKMVIQNREEAIYFRILKILSPALLVYVLAGVAANIIGYAGLANLIVRGSLSTLILALIFLATWVSLRALIYTLLRTSVAERSKIITRHRSSLTKSINLILGIGIFLLWAYYSLRSNLLLDPLIDWGIEVWSFGYTFGALTITVGRVIEFFLILLLSWLISHWIRMILREELLDRIDLPRGVPMAISSLTQYLLVALGVLLALATLGFDLQNLGILAGALGVGIGFGLQNIVNNFLSGLILVFERPVTEGDIVNVDGIDGKVVGIGIRASRIRQWDGAELIVPNEMLVSKRVVNWTRGIYKRRFVLTVYTGLEVIPEEIQQLITETCASIPGVLNDPPPATYFNGIEGYTYAFRLLYWLSSDILAKQSEVQGAVDKALRERGIKRQVPQPMRIIPSSPLGKANTSRKSEPPEPE